MTDENILGKNSFGSSEDHTGSSQTGELIMVLQEWYLEWYKSTEAMHLIVESWESSLPSEHCDTLKPQLLYDLASISTKTKAIMENLRTAREACLRSQSKTKIN